MSNQLAQFVVSIVMKEEEEGKIFNHFKNVMWVCKSGLTAKISLCPIRPNFSISRNAHVCLSETSFYKFYEYSHSLKLKPEAQAGKLKKRKKINKKKLSTDKSHSAKRCTKAK